MCILEVHYSAITLIYKKNTGEHVAYILDAFFWGTPKRCVWYRTK